MKRVSLWRKLRLYLEYRKSITKNKTLLLEKGLRIDRVKRIYTVINIPEELFQEVYNSSSSDIAKISRNYLVEATRDISKTLNDIGLQELYKSYATQKVDKYSFLIIIGFSLLDTKKIADRLYFIAIPFIVMILISIVLINFYL